MPASIFSERTGGKMEAVPCRRKGGGDAKRISRNREKEALCPFVNFVLAPAGTGGKVPPQRAKRLEGKRRGCYELCVSSRKKRTASHIADLGLPIRWFNFYQLETIRGGEGMTPPSPPSP